MRQRTALAALAVVGVALSACTAPATSMSWMAPVWSDATVSVTTMPQPLDAATASSLPAFRIRNDDVGVQARWVELPGDTRFDAHVTEIVTATIDARATASGVPYTPAVFPQGSGMDDRGCITGSTTRTASEILADPLVGPADGTGAAIVCDLVLAAGPYLGQRLRTVTSDGLDTAVVVYADTVTGEAATADHLWAEDTLIALHTELVNHFRRQTDSLGQSVQPPDDAGQALLTAALAQTVIASDGTVVVPIPPGFTSPELRTLGIVPTTEPLNISVPAHWLTPFGAAILSAATQNAAFAAPARTPAGREPVDCTLLPCVALTYDDGPSEFTAGILDELAKRQASATFFIAGERARFNATLMKRTVDEGHLVENHTWSHPMLPRLTPAQIEKEIKDTNAAILAATGTPARVFRPPYGEYNDTVLQKAAMAAILWDVDSLDYAKVADDIVLSRVVSLPRPGSIVLQHDIQENTARTAGAVYEGLIERGFVLVNLSQLFNDELPTSGVIRRLH